MNKHLNIFKTYAKDDRNYQLENDLTRALAICLQEDALFFHEVLKAILGNAALYNQLFEDLNGDTEVHIEIQKKTSQLKEFDRVFAVSLSESTMSDFWESVDITEYDPICDLVITINRILIIVEAKRNNVDCTDQLYNQIFNAFRHQGKNLKENTNDVTPFDLDWRKLMYIGVKVASFEKTTGSSNRFLMDFIELVKGHNFSWLPETPIGSLKSVSKNAITRRLDSAIVQFCKEDNSVEPLSYNNRLGTTFSRGWSNELLFSVEENTGDLVVDIYPGNTKGQGYSLFKKEPQFSETLNINGTSYKTKKKYHIKFMGQSYITGLWLNEDDFIKPLHTKHNFEKYSGRVKRADWFKIESLLDKHIVKDWRHDCLWQNRVLDSNRSQFDLSIGYRISIKIPFKTLAKLDENHNDIVPLAHLIKSIYKSFETDLILKMPT